MENFSDSISELCSPTSTSSRTLKCIICGSPRGDSSPDKVVFNQFCEKFLSLEKSALWRTGCKSVCSSCSESMHTAVDNKSRMEVVQGRVLRLQLQVVQELRELQIYLDLLGWQLGKIEGKVKEGDGENIHPGVAGRRSQIGLMPLLSGNASHDGDDDDAGGRSQADGEILLRKCIGNVTCDLRTFQNGLKRRVNCDAGAIVEDIGCRQPASKRVRVEGDTDLNIMGMEAADPDLEHDIGGNSGGDDGDDEDIDEPCISDNENLPQIQSWTTVTNMVSNTTMSSPSGEDSSDNGVPRVSTRSGNRRTLVIKRIKLEPGGMEPDSENGDDGGDNGNGGADDDTMSEVDNVPLSSSAYSGDPRLQLFLKEQRAFHQKFLQSQEALIQEQLELKAQVLRMLSTSQLDELQGSQSLLLSLFPIKSSEDLESVEDILEDPDNQEKLVSALSRFGRTEISRTTGDVMRYLLEVKFSREVRFTNSSGKIPFGEKRLCECVRVALHKNHPEVKMNDVNTKIASWLRGSIDRGGGRRERQGNGNVTVNNEEDESSQQHQEDHQDQ